MSKFLLALSLIFFASSCSNAVEKKKKINISDSTVPQQSSFTCNYPEYKARSKRLFNDYIAKPDSSKKHALLNNIRDSLFTCWLGTPWDFYGTTEEPNNGKIACGYFVTTLLRDIGVAVNRIQHAQCASEEMIKAVCIKNSLYRFSNVNVLIFNEKIKTKGIGLYVVGLDFHTGFILNDGEQVYFIHSNYAGKKEVTKEIAIESVVLSSSKYKVIGKII